MFLIKFNYDYYCQGWERTTETCLVYATDYESACIKISKQDKYKDVKDFQNLTIR